MRRSLVQFGKILLCTFAAAAAAPSAFASSINGVRISQVDVNKGYGSGGVIFIKLSASPSKTGCAAGSVWDYTLTVSTDFDRALYAQILSALATQATVDVTGLNACNEVGTIESLRSVQVNQ